MALGPPWSHRHKLCLWLPLSYRPHLTTWNPTGCPVSHTKKHLATRGDHHSHWEKGRPGELKRTVLSNCSFADREQVILSVECVWTVEALTAARNCTWPCSNLEGQSSAMPHPLLCTRACQSRMVRLILLIMSFLLPQGRLVLPTNAPWICLL